MTELLLALRIVDPATLTVSILLGIVTGAISMPTLQRMTGGDPARLAFVAFAGHLVVGVPWLLMMLVTRYLEGSPTWAGWIGAILLWVVTGVSAYAVLRLRSR